MGFLLKNMKFQSSPTPAWNEADREYIPPGSKKVKKESKPVVVVKKEKKEKSKSLSKLPRSRVETLDYWHSNTNKVAHQPPELGGPGLERVMLPSQSFDSSADIKPDVGHPARGPYSLNSQIDAAARAYAEALEKGSEHINTDEFKQGVLKEIQIETARNLDLKNQVMIKEQQVNAELEKGKKHVIERVNELGMSSAETPNELLSNSKKIVADHKELTLNVAAMEAEVAHISGKTRNAVPYGGLLLDHLHQLDDPSLWDLEKGNQYMQYITKIAVENGHAPPKEPEPETVDEAVLSPTGPRQRRTKPRNGPGRKGKQEEATSEDVERQVKEFVQVALSVDQQAKEKERRARAAGGPPSEKPSKKGAAAGASFDSVGVPLPRTTYPGPGSYTVELRQPEPQPFPQENTAVTSTN